MFDTIGRHRDDEATRRSFAALLVASLFVGAGGAFTVGLLGYQVAETLVEPVVSEEVAVLIEELDAIEKPALPELPKGRPGPVGASGRSGDVEDRVVEPPVPEAAPEADTPDPSVQDLPKERPVVNSTGTSGPVGNTDSVGDGDCIGCGDGGGGGRGDLVLHSSEMEARRRPFPRYPEAAMGLGLGEQACAVQLRVDEKGFTRVLGVQGCDPVFHDEARRALSRWRWWPKRVNGAKVAARTQVKVVFKP